MHNSNRRNPVARTTPRKSKGWRKHVRELAWRQRKEREKKLAKG